MSYAQRRPISASRTFAIAIVALTHASLGYAIVSGLDYSASQRAADGLKTFNVEEVPPPPPEPRLAPKKVQEPQPRLVAPQPLVRVNEPSPPVAPTNLESPPPVAMPVAAPARAAPVDPLRSNALPSPIETVPPRSATGDLQNLFRPADYPLTAREHAEEGSVTVQLTVGVRGRVRACDVTSSSGSRTLDNASCRILQRRALFTPARDSSGSPTTDTVSQEIRWVLHREAMLQRRTIGR